MSWLSVMGTVSHSNQTVYLAVRDALAVSSLVAERLGDEGALFMVKVATLVADVKMGVVISGRRENRGAVESLSVSA